MLAEIRTELTKLIKKPRTYIGPAAMACLVILLFVAVKYGNPLGPMKDRLQQDFIVSGDFINAAFMARSVLFPPPMWLMFLPFFACLVCGDILASEAADGTLRTMLCRPVTRTGVAVSKYIVSVLYVAALTFGTGVFAYLLGLVFLGHGNLITLNMGQGGIWIIPEREAIIRLLEVYSLVAAGMVAVGSLSFAISTFVSNSNGAVAGSVGLLIISAIIGEIEYFARIKPYLISTYLMQVNSFFTDRLNSALYWKSMEVMAVYSLAFLAVGLIIFRRRDILA